ncbi:DNA supercoiling protein [Cryptococcus neoformans]|nr:DNA supercoiling protein [Cryptococcus neoformans var. grubii Th84]OXH06427.1 DNA supercoiling protein [Cryptococcus neoformans var. grubii]OXH28016.1 DNA supercoiling protein [Cryptococcus neoformans var. grubii]OXH47651.1 DNA supercoiling protein [Cryptococcus neoformans var. grubii]OXH51129.1 DNA supercoiling protein [Cryptococcus neoformans var. grubii]
MAQYDYIQLGSVILPAPADSTLPLSSWTPLTSAIVDSFTSSLPSSRLTIGLISKALNDPGLGFQAEICSRGTFSKIRCRVTPSDAQGSIWKRLPWKGRDTVVKGLLKTFERVWDYDDVSEGVLMSLTTEDNQSMQDIYASVPSPEDPLFGETKNPLDQELYDSLSNYENPHGILTSLYLYQIRSVAKMLQMETNPHKLVDPLFTPFREAGNNRTYYINLSTWDIQRHPGWFDLPRGGILCEQMGTGKTLMCLALITSTQHQPTLPPDNNIEISPVFTTIAERSYPFSSHSDLRALTAFPCSQTALAFPSLVELCCNILSMHSPSAKRSSYLPPQIRPLLDRKSFYCILPSDEDCLRTVRKRRILNKAKKLYLAKGTLVVVPHILVAQWKLESEKHTEDGVLRLLEVGPDELPSVEKLLDYDIILIDVARFASEETSFREKHNFAPSVLLQARWKRMILDEGHVAYSKISNAMRMAMQLSVERRWIVSGTPTRNLQQGGEMELQEMDLSDIHGSSNNANGTTSRRAWSKRDIEDASRLGVMMGGYLAAEPFKSEGRFQQYVTAHLRGKNGPSFGAVQRMKYLLSGILVKHGPKVIDTEARLPPLTILQEVIQFDPLQRVTYNVLAALIASNVYTSGGEDVDYFLHPRNVESFNQVVTNLHLACFWYSARDMEAENCLVRTHDWLRNHPHCSEHVRKNLQEACQHLQTALETPGWTEWMENGISIPCDGAYLPPLIKQAWSDSFDTQPDMVDVHSLNSLRALNVMGANIQELHMVGWQHRSHKCDWFWEILTKGVPKHVLEIDFGRKAAKAVAKLKIKKHREGKGRTTSAAHAPKAVPASPSKLMKKRTAREGEIDDRLNEARTNAIGIGKELPKQIDEGSRPLPLTIVTKTRSAKVNFILQAILDAPKNDKFVIFGNNYELGHLTEALDLLDIASTFVGHTLHVENRRLALDYFEMPGVRVCLMDLKLAARGLNLVSANRVIFLGPVWSLDVQAQAIKRVHRIGQTRPTLVQILVTEGTFEEDIARRSTASRSANEEQLYSRAMIENPRFVYAEKTQTSAFTVRFIPKDQTLNPSENSRETTQTGAAYVNWQKVGNNANATAISTSPTAEFGACGALDQSILDFPRSVLKKREGDGLESTIVRKKARVTFA